MAITLPDKFAIMDRVVTQECNDQLCKTPDEDEVYEANRCVNKNSAPGPDGFTGHFCMDLINEF